MRALPRIPSTAMLRSLEAEWIKTCGSSWGQVLMEIAGRAAAEVAYKCWQERPSLVAVVCGDGNNGGDGLVIARYLTLWKVPTIVYVVARDQSDSVPPMRTDESKTNMRILSELGVEIQAMPDDFETAIAACGLVIDALLGTGLDREVAGNYKRAIDAITRSTIRTVSVDVPSGINSDTGQVMGVAIAAHQTVTFGYLKPGLLQHPGAQHAGLLTVVDIGLPELPHENEIYLATREFVNASLPFRPDNSHKGTFGSVLMIGGSSTMFGAPVLSGKSALRTGAGLCMVAAPASIIPHLPAAELIYIKLTETEDGTISSASLKTIENELAKVHSVILGPGISQNESTIEFVQSLLPLIADSGKGCVVDADALNALAKNTKRFPTNAERFVLTPHPKEFSRLMETTVSEIQADRLASVRNAAQKFGCTIVLKGSRTVTADSHGTVYINPTGNSGMATAGSGDVLSGIIGGLIAQGISPSEAAVSGVYIHGVAGDIAAQDIYGHAGITAGDISYSIPKAVSEIRQGMQSVLEAQLNGVISELG